MIRTLRPAFAALVLVLALVPTAQAQESNDHNDFAQTLDDTTSIASLAMPAVRLLSHDPKKRETGRHLADAVIIDVAIATALKETIHSSRPSGGDDGFPSRHASVAFAVATCLYEREPKTGWIAFPLAAAAGWARVDLNEHTWWQVIAGAAIGAYVGHQCGEGKWRLFGHKDDPAAVTTSFAEPVESEPRFIDPVHAGPTRQSTWGTAIWHTAF